VTVQGRVSSFYYKQLCLHCCLRVAGVRKIVDEILVEPRSDAPRSIREEAPAVSNLREPAGVSA
jgi:hypothetical protein